jgi:4-amino-4-deoxy-L-arabinose transferase-like glycosyltransferase
MRRPWLIPAACGVLALLARLPLLRVAPTPVNDTDDYFGIATTIFHGADAAGSYAVNTRRTPGYPLVVGLLEPLPGDWQHGVIVVQALLGVALAIAVAALGRRWFGAITGAVAGTLTAISPLLVANERLLTPDALFACLVFAGAALLAEAVRRERPSTSLLAAAGAVFGVAALVKPAAQVFVLAGLIPLALATRDVRATLRGSAVLALALVVCVAPWVARNAIAYDRPVLSTLLGQSLWLRVFDLDGQPLPDTPEADRLAEVLERESRRPESAGVQSAYLVFRGLRREGLSQSEASEREGTVARQAIADHPFSYLEGTLRETKAMGEQTAAANTASATPAAAELPRGAPWGFRGLAHRLWKVGHALSEVWWLLSLHALLAVVLLLSRRREVRLAGASLVSCWLLLALTTGATVGGYDGFTRFPAQGAALLWLSGTAAVVICAGALLDAWRSRRI